MFKFLNFRSLLAVILLVLIVLSLLPSVYGASSKYEAENGVLGGTCAVDTQGSGWTGTGFVGYIDAADGNYISIPVYVATAGDYYIDFRYSSGMDTAQTLSIYINDTHAGDVSFAPTGNWDTTWATATGSFKLNAGDNTVKIQYDPGDGPADMDYIFVYDSSSKPTPPPNPSATPVPTPTPTPSPIILPSPKHVSNPVCGAKVPFTTYEAEKGTLGGGASLGKDADIIAASKGRAYVSLNTAGQYVKFSKLVKANRLTIRYNIPKNEDGTISLYVNGIHSQDIRLTSKYCYDPNHPGGRQYYEQVVSVNIARGDTIKLQKNSSDSCSSYNIDLIDLEVAPKALTMPSGFISINSFGARGNDTIDDTTAIQDCINAAKSQKKGIWIPSGTYYISKNFSLPAGMTVKGAGIWYSKMYRTRVVPHDTGIFNIAGNNVSIYNLRFDSETNSRDSECYAIISNDYNYLLVQDCWFDRFTTVIGDWFGANNQKAAGSHETFRNLRIRETYADGIHLPEAGSDNLVENCHIRGTGDDAIAIYNLKKLPNACNNIIRFNTTEANYWGRGICIAGSANTTVSNNITDSSILAGISVECDATISTWPCNPVVNCKVLRNSIINCTHAGENDQYGALTVIPMSNPVDVLFDSNYIENSYAAAIKLCMWNNEDSGGTATFKNNILSGKFMRGVWENNTSMTVNKTGNTGF